MRKALIVFVTVLGMGGISPSPAQATTSPHVAVIILENVPFNKVIGNADAPYINSLTAKGTLSTDYFAVAPGSAHNYRAIIGGVTTKPSGPTKNLLADLQVAGHSWGEYDESMGTNCGGLTSEEVPGTTQKLFVRGHDAAFQFRVNEACPTNDVAMTPSSFHPTSLPEFSLIIPNECDNGHTLPDNKGCPAFDGSRISGPSKLNIADQWCSKVIPQLLTDPTLTVILTWDEGIGGDEHIVTLAVGAGHTQGTTDGTRYNHYSLEAGLYAAYGLGTAPGGGGDPNRYWNVFPIP